MDKVIELLITEAELLVVISECECERDFPFRDQAHNGLHSLVRRFPTSHIPGKDHEFRLFHLQHLADTLQCNVGTRVVRDVMHVRELDNLELALPVETHSGLGKCRNHQEQC